MTNETQAAAEPGPVAPAEPPKLWKPSRRPDHGAGDQRLVIERPQEGGVIAALARYLKRPFVKLVLGLGLFILGAIIYDATINFGSWTERPAKKKATKHRGVAPIPRTPDG